MANQIIIDIGAVANDGTGDPLRTAFGFVNNNFSNVWASGVANSNIQFDGNRILTTNTNGNLVLSPNGIGKVQANVDIVPNANNALSLGSLTRQWNTVYAQNLSVGGNVEFNDLTVNGNLTVEGNTIQIGNIVTDTKTIQLANTAGTANAANGSGITVGANDNIATLLYNSLSNVWTTNIGLTVTGNLTTFTGTVSSNNINFTNDLYGKTGTFTGDTRGENSIYAGVPLFTSLGSDVVAQFSGNVDAYTQFNFQNGNAGPQASGDYVITADNGNDSTHFINMGITSSTWDGSQTNSLGNILTPNDGYLYVQDGNLVVGTVNGTTNAWKFGTDGRLTFPGTPRIDTDANNFEVQAAESVNFEANAVVNIYTDTSGTTYQWQFDDTGNLNLPNNGSINFNAGRIVQAVDEDFSIRVQDADDDGFALLLQVDDGAGAVLGSTELQRDRFVVEFAGGGAPQFRFTENGQTELPGNVRWDTYTDQSLYAVADNVNNGTIELKTISFSNDTLGSNIRVSQSNATISTGNAQHTWLFDNTGILTVPGNIVTDWLDIGNIGNTATLQADVSLQIVANASGSALYWTFNSDGTLFVPGRIAGDNNGPLIIDGNGSGTEGYISLPASNFGGEQIAIVNQFSLGNGIVLATNGGSWHFDNTGNLTVPGNIVMPAFSSLVGDGASPAPSISGFSNGGFGGNVSVTGNITGGNLSVTGNISGNTAGYAIGYRDIPQVSFTGNATIATTDAGKHFYSTQSSNFTLTIANNASQGFQVGAAITVVNQGTGTITIAQGSGVTLYLAGNATAGNRSVSTFGMATIMKVATDTWFINGTGVS